MSLHDVWFTMELTLLLLMATGAACTVVWVAFVGTARALRRIQNRFKYAQCRHCSARVSRAYIKALQSRDYDPNAELPALLRKQAG